MLGRRQQNENAYTNREFSDLDTSEKHSWQEINRSSIEISSDHETLIPGELGITLVRGTLSSFLGKNKKPCFIKMLKGIVKYVLFQDKLLFDIE
jgi:hypothetical protein